MKMQYMQLSLNIITSLHVYCFVFTFLLYRHNTISHKKTYRHQSLRLKYKYLLYTTFCIQVNVQFTQEVKKTKIHLQKKEKIMQISFRVGTTILTVQPNIHYTIFQRIHSKKRTRRYFIKKSTNTCPTNSMYRKKKHLDGD